MHNWNSQVGCSSEACKREFCDVRLPDDRYASVRWELGIAKEVLHLQQLQSRLSVQGADLRTLQEDFDEHLSFRLLMAGAALQSFLVKLDLQACVYVLRFHSAYV
jgi:hypothetical protein